MTMYSGFWKKLNDGRLVRLRVAAYGWNGCAYFVHAEAKPGDMEFSDIESLSLPGHDGPRTVIARYFELREALANQATELVADGIVTFPEDLAWARAKSTEEQWLDAAALHIEIDAFDQAQSCLMQASPLAQSFYHRTLSRRLALGRARMLPEEDVQQRKQHMALAYRHADGLLRATHGLDLYALKAYTFGDSYRSVAAMVAYAATTRAEYLLSYADDLAQVLAALDIAIDTYCAESYVYELKVDVLLKLAREREAFELHKAQRLEMASVLGNIHYQVFVQAADRQAEAVESSRRDALKIERLRGRPISPSGVVALQARFSALPTVYLDWVSRDEDMVLCIRDGECVEEYRFFNADEALAKHQEMDGWIHLHDETWPAGAAEIQEMIRESGINPSQMLPIVGADHTPDMFLLRLDGEQPGAAYFWGHDESGTFEYVVANVDELFDWLEASARAGHTFVL